MVWFCREHRSYHCNLTPQIVDFLRLDFTNIFTLARILQILLTENYIFKEINKKTIIKFMSNNFFNKNNNNFGWENVCDEIKAKYTCRYGKIIHGKSFHDENAASICVRYVPKACHFKTNDTSSLFINPKGIQ